MKSRYCLIFYLWCAFQNVDATPVITEMGSDAASSGAASSTTSADSNLSLNERVRLLERQSSNLAQMDVTGQIATLSQEVADLKGKLEEQAHALQVLQTQAQAQYHDLSTRLPEVSASTEKTVNAKARQALSGVASSAQEATAVAGEDLKAYQAATKLILKKDYVRATKSLNRFVSQYADSVYLPNAHFWLGEIDRLQGQPDQAIQEFSIVARQYPKNEKVPEALLGLGLSYLDQGNRAQARATFEKVRKHFPGTSAAQAAAAQLLTLKKSAAS